MTAAIFIIFLCGIANFAMQKATMESRHPLVQHMRASMGKSVGNWGGYALEFAVLLGALFFANMGSLLAVGVYGGYTGFNAVAAYMLLSGRL